MTSTRTTTTELPTMSPHRHAVVGTVIGALGAAAAVWMFWLVLPGIVLGLAAVALGISARRRTSSESGNVAVALGVTALLLVPSVLMIADDAEDWGRDCALNPSNPDC